MQLFQHRNKYILKYILVCWIDAIGKCLLFSLIVAFIRGREGAHIAHSIIRAQSIIRAFNYDQNAGSGMAQFLNTANCLFFLYEAASPIIQAWVAENLELEKRTSILH